MLVFVFVLCVVCCLIRVSVMLLCRYVGLIFFGVIVLLCVNVGIVSVSMFDVRGNVVVLKLCRLLFNCVISVLLFVLKLVLIL